MTVSMICDNFHKKTDTDSNREQAEHTACANKDAAVVPSAGSMQYPRRAEEGGEEEGRGKGKKTMRRIVFLTYIIAPTIALEM